MSNRFGDRVVEEFVSDLERTNSRGGVTYSKNAVRVYKGDARGLIREFVNGERSKKAVYRTIGSLSADDIHDSLTGSNLTINRKAIGISRLLDYLVSNGMIDNNPLDGDSRALPREHAKGEQRVYITPDRLDKVLMRACTRDKVPSKVWSVISLGRGAVAVGVVSDTALQSQDLVKLVWDNFDDKFTKLKPLRKNMSEIKLSPSTTRSLGVYRKYCDFLEKKSGKILNHLFMNRSLGVISDRSYRRQIIDGFLNPAYRSVVMEENGETGKNEIPQKISHLDLRFSRGIEWMKKR